MQVYPEEIRLSCRRLLVIPVCFGGYSSNLSQSEPVNSGINAAYISISLLTRPISTTAGLAQVMPSCDMRENDCSHSSRWAWRGLPFPSREELREQVMKKTNSHNQNCSSLHSNEQAGASDEQNLGTFAQETKDGPMRLL